MEHERVFSLDEDPFSQLTPIYIVEQMPRVSHPYFGLFRRLRSVPLSCGSLSFHFMVGGLQRNSEDGILAFVVFLTPDTFHGYLPEGADQALTGCVRASCQDP